MCLCVCLFVHVCVCSRGVSIGVSMCVCTCVCFSKGTGSVDSLTTKTTDSSVDKESACNAGDMGSILGLGRSPGEGNVSPLQYFCLENPMDRETGRLQSRGCKSWTRLSG